MAEPVGTSVRGPLTGRTIITTRDQPGDLDIALGDRGAQVVPLALIRIVDGDLDGAADALAHGAQWLVVTSRHGARLVGPLAASAPDIRLAAVGRSTAQVLERGARRTVELVPHEQRARALVEMFRDVPVPADIVVAHGDLAEPTLVDGLEGLGHRVRSVIVYRNEPRYPDEAELAAVRSADAVVLMSGSAARVWAEIVAGSPALSATRCCAVGPTTAAAARRAGLHVDMVAAQFSVEGVVETLIEYLGS